MANQSACILKNNTDAFEKVFVQEKVKRIFDSAIHKPVRMGIISKQAFSIINFRGPLIKDLIRNGIVVYAFAADYDDATRRGIEKLGAVPVDISMCPTGTNPLRDIIDLIRLASLLRKYSLDITFCFFIKPVIYGTLAARIAGVSNRFAMIEGAGYVFDDQSTSSLSRRLLRQFVVWLYRIALGQADRVFFLNLDDRTLFIENNIVSANKISMLNGIGVDLEHYQYSPPNKSQMSFILVARLLIEKGILEYAEAARRIKEKYPEVRFILLGNVDSEGNSSCIPVQRVKEWVADDIVEWPGHVSDVRPWIAQSSVFVLPSYYREGLPRSTQEAMAIGRAVITTDWVGCRETVKDGVNGIKVPIRDIDALVEAMLTFIEQPELTVTMGANSRLMAEKNFNVQHINSQIMNDIEASIHASDHMIDLPVTA